MPFPPSRRLGEASRCQLLAVRVENVGKGVRHLPNGQASARRLIPIPPNFCSVQQPNTAGFGLKDAGGYEPVHGSTLCFRSVLGEHVRLATWCKGAATSSLMRIASPLPLGAGNYGRHHHEDRSESIPGSSTSSPA